VLDPSERMLIVPALGADAVYAVPLEQGMLGEPLRFGVKAGSGPRHVAFDRGRTLLVCELSSELSLLNGAHGKGGLYELGRVSLLPPGVSSAGNTGADVHVHPGGRFAYVSNRGHDSIAVFAVDGPEPRLLAHTPTRGRVPRNFALSPDGQLLLVANLGSDSIAAFRIDASSGTLEPLALNEGIAEPFWVGFAR
jgi:6-phosphogluconolactonase